MIIFFCQLYFTGPCPPPAVGQNGAWLLCRYGIAFLKSKEMDLIVMECHTDNNL